MSLIETTIAAVAAPNHIAFPDLGLDPIIVQLGPFALRWYSMAYVAGILIGYWYLLKLIAQPGSPMARRHADDLVCRATDAADCSSASTRHRRRAHGESGRGSTMTVSCPLACAVHAN